MKNILIISYVSPYPPDSGGSSGIYHMINGIRNHFNITLVFPFLGSKSELAPLDTIWPNVKIKVCLLAQKKGIGKIYLETKRWIKRKIFFSRQLLNYDSDLELKYRSILFHRGFYTNPAFYLYVESLVINNTYDLIQVEFYQLLPLIYILPANVPKVFVHHELRFVKAKREFDLLADKKIEYLNIIENIKQEEFKYLRLYDHIITFTEIDNAFLAKELVGLTSFISPLCIKSENITLPNDFNFQNKISFIGGSAHFPNADGLYWFLLNIWPLILSKHPNIQLIISGKWEKRYIKKFKKYRNIHFLGFVPNLYNEIKNSIMIVPIRVGSGMRIKIIDAVNFGIPFVSTSIGVEGLEFKHNHDCLIADEPDQFAQCLLSLISNIDKQREIVKNASITMKQKYSADISIERRLKVYTQIFHN